jgi:hypothetical protein
VSSAAGAHAHGGSQSSWYRGGSLCLPSRCGSRRVRRTRCRACHPRCVDICRAATDGTRARVFRAQRIHLRRLLPVKCLQADFNTIREYALFDVQQCLGLQYPHAGPHAPAPAVRVPVAIRVGLTERGEHG